MGANTQIRVIASLPLYLDASVWTWQECADDTLKVLMSPILSEWDPEYEPVFDFIIEHCTREINRETHEDAGWMGGEYRHTDFTVFASCPGSTIEHSCAYRKQEVSPTEVLDG